MSDFHAFYSVEEYHEVLKAGRGITTSKKTVDLLREALNDYEEKGLRLVTTVPDEGPDGTPLFVFRVDRSG